MYQEINPGKTTLKEPAIPTPNYNNIPTIPKKKGAADGMQLIKKQKKAGREPEKTTCRKQDFII